MIGQFLAKLHSIERAKNNKSEYDRIKIYVVVVVVVVVVVIVVVHHHHHHHQRYPSLLKQSLSGRLTRKQTSKEPKVQHLQFPTRTHSIP